MSTVENENNNSKPINPYLNRNSAVSWLKQKGIRVVDEHVTYHSSTESNEQK